VASFGVCLRYADVLMRDNADAQPSSVPDASPEGRLDSWKEIAAYLSRGIRTVQRWEREEGLPVHRLLHDKRGTIYARKDELAAWWESRRRTLANPATSDAVDSPVTPRLERLTRTAATTAWPTLSSDARLLAYISDAGRDGETPQVWVQQIRGAAICLTSGDREYSNLSFSPDDTKIIFTAADAGGQHVYEVPALGGEMRLLKSSSSAARYSPDGEWLAYVPLDGSGIRIAARDGAGFRSIGSELLDVNCLTWLSDWQLMVQARSRPEREPEWWIVPTGGGSVSETGLNRALRQRGTFPLPGSAGWLDNSLVFAAVGAVGVNLYRQRFVPASLQLAGPTEQLTVGNESSALPAVAAGRVAFVSSGVATNLFSLPLDANGLAQGSLRRMTRGPAPVTYLTTTRDFRTLAYFSARIGEGDIVLRDLETGTEKVAPPATVSGKGYPALSPSGRQLAYGLRVQERRPIFIAELPDGTHRMLGEDCGGRPREWIDERFLVIERFARLNSIAVIDTVTGDQQDIVAANDCAIRNPRLSPDRRWLAFDSTRPGEPSRVITAPFRRDGLIPESEWISIEQSSSHPFWSADGKLLYFVPAGANAAIRTAIRARHLSAASGQPESGPIAVYSSTEMMMPAFLPGTTPLAVPGQILFVLGDFRGDIWMLDLNTDR
jgi:Tol biopolymer transport system component